MSGRVLALIGMLLFCGGPVLRAAPETPDEIKGRADRAMAAGSTDEALALYGQALTLDPNHWPSLCRMGEIHAASRKYAEAEQELRKAVAINPGSGLCLSRLAQVLLVTEKPAEAEPFLQRAAELLPSDEGVLFNLARLYETTGRTEQALAAYQKYLAAAPASQRAPTAHLKVARMLSDSRKTDASVDHYRAFLKAQPSRMEVRAELGGLLMAASRYKEALVEYDQVLASGVADGAILANAGALCLLLEDTPRALDLLDRAVKADPAPIAPRIGLATVLAKTGDHERAVSLLSAVVKDEPDNNRAWFLMGQSLMKLGRTAEARSALQRHQEIHEKIMKERMSGGAQGHP